MAWIRIVLYVLFLEIYYVGRMKVLDMDTALIDDTLGHGPWTIPWTGRGGSAREGRWLWMHNLRARTERTRDEGLMWA